MNNTKLSCTTNAKYFLEKTFPSIDINKYSGVIW